jgi:hypothetical protein
VGKHYVPQEYLRGFSSSADRALIWMFDKVTRQWSEPAISQAAQTRDFYPPDIEVALDRHVEAPGNAALKVLRAGGKLAQQQFEDLFFYIAVMLMRVPRKRRKGWEAVPEVLESTMSRFRTEIENLRGQHNEERVAAALKLLDDLESRYADDPPSEVKDQITSPWPSPRVAEVVRTMTWRLVAVPPQHYLITSDNPAYFFESLGLGRPESELTFPVSPSLALLGSRQGPPGALLHVTAKAGLAKELNRRVASGAERFVFSKRKAEWIETISLRKNPSLNRINW